MIDLTKPVALRDGTPARIVSSDGATGVELTAMIRSRGPESYEYPIGRPKDGRVMRFPGEHRLDLINVPDTEENVVFVNLGAAAYTTKQIAQNEAPNWPVVKLRLSVGLEDGLEDLREVLSAEVA